MADFHIVTYNETILNVLDLGKTFPLAAYLEEPFAVY